MEEPLPFIRLHLPLHVDVCDVHHIAISKDLGRDVAAVEVELLVRGAVRLFLVHGSFSLNSSSDLSIR